MYAQAKSKEILPQWLQQKRARQQEKRAEDALLGFNVGYKLMYKPFLMKKLGDKYGEFCRLHRLAVD